MGRSIISQKDAWEKKLEIATFQLAASRDIEGLEERVCLSLFSYLRDNDIDIVDLAWNQIAKIRAKGIFEEHNRIAIEELKKAIDEYETQCGNRGRGGFFWRGWKHSNASNLHDEISLSIGYFLFITIFKSAMKNRANLGGKGGEEVLGLTHGVDAPPVDAPPVDGSTALLSGGGGGTVPPNDLLPGGSGGESDSYTDRLLKYIPAEVVGVFIAINAITKDNDDINPVLGWAILAVLTVLNYGYLYRVQKVKEQSHLALSTIAFVVWVFAIGGPFEAYTEWYHPVYGGILLPLFTLTAAVYQGQ